VIAISNDVKTTETKLINNRNTRAKTEFDSIKGKLTRSFEQIKDQFGDHLEAINENTNEVQSNFEYICELDRKIDKLSEKIDQLNMALRQQKGEPAEEKKFEIKQLTKKEKEVFHALYVLTEGRKYTTYKEIARRSCYSETLVSSYITSLIEKGIPVIKKYTNRTAYLNLGIDFREVQAKENIVGINTLLTNWVR